ncbi:MAG: hypothetical protein ACRD0H_13240, partial [Actinomycetes bacterium]
ANTLREAKLALDAERVAGTTAGTTTATGTTTAGGGGTSAGATPKAGLAKPHGSGLDESTFGQRLTGPKLTRTATSDLAAQLSSGDGSLPGGSGPAGELIPLWRQAAAEYLAEVTDGPAMTQLRTRFSINPRAPPGAVMFHRLNTPIVDRLTGLAADAGHKWVNGVLHVYAIRDNAAGVLHELVEAVFAPWAGFTDDQAHTVAVLAERGVADPAHQSGTWLTARARAEIDPLALEGRIDALTVLVGGYDAVVARIMATFDGHPAWRAALLGYAAAFHQLAEATLGSLVQDYHREQRRARVTGFGPMVKRTLREQVNTAAADSGLDAAVDGYNGAGDRLDQAARDWRERAGWSTFAVAKLREADAT